MTISLAPSVRARELLDRMTLEEKAQQVSAVMPTALMGAAGLDPAAMERVIGFGIGHVSNIAFTSTGPESLARSTNEVQRFLVERTRLGIPAVFHAEALNGFVAPGYTSFPTAIGLAATWHPDLIERMAETIARQMRSVGVLQALSPVMDIARDARWGRVHETYGEDVYLTTAMSVAFVRGLQGLDLATGVMATGKHFLGYAMTEAGQNMAATHLGKRELYDVYATPFEAAIKLAGLRSVMNSYSEIDGVPAGASHELLTELLRGRMGFDGSVVSDYTTVEWLHTRQFVAASPAEAGTLALRAGLDVELPLIVGYGQNLVAEIRAGRLAEDVLNQAVERVLTDKFALGLFERPYVDDDPIVINAIAREGAEVSESLAAESITLLKNDGVLPLATSTKVAVIGPNAEDAIVNFAAYTYPATVDMMKGMATGESRMAGVEGMQESTPEAAAGLADRMRQLMAIDTNRLARDEYGALGLADAIRKIAVNDVESVAGVHIRADDEQDIPAAIAAAQRADVVIVAMGGRGGWFGTRITEGEGTDAAAIELPAHQVDLIRQLAATGTPLVGVVFQGRAYALTEVNDLLAAIVVAYYPGPSGAQAIGSVLFGDRNPSGRLPYSIPRATGQMPLYYGQKHGSGYRRGAGDMFRNYIDLEPTPLYPFGHGLSYTSFDYEPLTLTSSDVPVDGGRLTCSVRVRNTGDQDGIETVQFYASASATGVTRPALQLVGFTRLELRAGESATATCEVDIAQLGYSGIDGRFILEPGRVTASVGASSADIRAQAEFTITGETTDLEGRRAYLSTTTVTP